METRRFFEFYVSRNPTAESKADLTSFREGDSFNGEGRRIVPAPVRTLSKERADYEFTDYNSNGR